MRNRRSYYIILFLLLVFLQLFLFNQIDLFISDIYAPYILVYPLIIMILPVYTNSLIVMGLGFTIGIFIDIVMGTYGVHAGASTFMAFLRWNVLSLMEDKGGYAPKSIPSLTDENWSWVLLYDAILLFLHSIALFTLEIFTFYFFWSIFIKALLTTILSVIAVMAIQFLYKP